MGDVAYCCFVNSKFSGLLTRVSNMAKSANDITFMVFTDTEVEFHQDNVINITVPKYVNSLQILLLPLFIKFKLNQYQYDVVILRSLFPSPFYLAAFLFNKFKLVTEHHSFIISEYKALRQFRNLIISFMFYRLCMSLSDGFIFISNEVKRKYSLVTKPSIVIANGIYYDNSAQTGYRSFDDKSLDILFLASVYAPWHGIERLINSIENWNLSYKANIHIIGDIKECDVDVDPTNTNVVYHGYLEMLDIMKITRQCNFSASTLQCEKISEEASSLKTREYILLNIPFIYSYDDTDIPEEQNFCLKLSSDEELIPWGAIKKFLHSISINKNEVIEAMRSYSIKVSYKKKMQSLLDFVRNSYG